MSEIKHMLVVWFGFFGVFVGGVTTAMPLLDFIESHPNLTAANLTFLFVAYTSLLFLAVFGLLVITDRKALKVLFRK